MTASACRLATWAPIEGEGRAEMGSTPAEEQEEIIDELTDLIPSNRR